MRNSVNYVTLVVTIDATVPFKDQISGVFIAIIFEKMCLLKKATFSHLFEQPLK